MPFKACLSAYITLLILHMHKLNTASISLIPIHIYLQSLYLINPPHIPHIYLHSLHLIINPLPYTYTAYILLIHLIYPTYSCTAYISLMPHIHLHSLHLINPPHIPTQPKSHQSPTHTNTAIHLMHYNLLHIPTQPTSS